MKTRHMLFSLLIALVGGVSAVFVYSRLDNNTARGNVLNSPRPYVWQASLPRDFNPNNLDFTYAAERTVHGVVHVVTTRIRESRRIRDPFDFFFGPREREAPEPETGFGSGVIITEDGYIVTNHHVITGADEIQVTLNDQRVFEALLVGTDPNTDIAVLKIDATYLPYLEFGDSDNLRLGEWVLAVGNPFGLTSSVTAGIISAKDRVLGVLREGEMPLESFLQTDAAVNMGNSGGALVNLSGELVGIPTLIISPTRTNIGTAFAVPSAIVERVLKDIVEYGEVRRAILGVSIIEVTPQFASERGLEVAEGVYVESVVEGGAAYNAGIRRGDVVLEIDANKVNTSGALQRAIARHQPGDNVNITVRRNGRILNFRSKLLGMQDYRELVLQHTETFGGATLRLPPEDLLQQLGLPGGVQIIELKVGVFQRANVQEGFIIVAVNKVRVNEPADIVRLLENHSGNVIIEGAYPNGAVAVYNFGL